jgi:C4-dicarboxylate-specific signal transduction histidine kinase
MPPHAHVRHFAISPARPQSDPLEQYAAGIEIGALTAVFLLVAAIAALLRRRRRRVRRRMFRERLNRQHVTVAEVTRQVHARASATITPSGSEPKPVETTAAP